MPNGAELKPGFQSSEFVATVLVHLLAGAVTLLDVLHVHWDHVSAVQGAIPLASLLIAGIVQAAYNNNRTRLKAQQMGHQAEAKITAFERFLDRLEALEETVEVVDPKVKKAVKGAQRVRRAVETGVVPTDSDTT